MGIFEDNFIVGDTINECESIKTYAICRHIFFSMIFSTFVLWSESSHENLIIFELQYNKADFRKLELWKVKSFYYHIFYGEILIVRAKDLMNSVLSAMVE